MQLGIVLKNFVRCWKRCTPKHCQPAIRKGIPSASATRVLCPVVTRTPATFPVRKVTMPLVSKFSFRSTSSTPNAYIERRYCSNRCYAVAANVMPKSSPPKPNREYGIPKGITKPESEVRFCSSSSCEVTDDRVRDL